MAQWEEFEFNFGFNAHEETPTYECMGAIKCQVCGKHHGYCSEMSGTKLDDALREIEDLKDFIRAHTLENNPMNLATYRGKESSKTKFEKRDWLDSEDLPKKGSKTFTINAFREAKKKTKGIIGFIDISAGSLKRVMSLRKGFTLDAFLDELGTNTDKWPGKKIKLERGGSEGQYINVSQ